MTKKVLVTLLLCFTFILVCLLAVNPPSVADLQSYPSFPAFLQQPDYILDFEERMPVHEEKKIPKNKGKNETQHLWL